ncbi:MAG TPA: MYXO-CTERM sorting domain-containing protein [Polyangiaceae bacterium]
MLAERQILCCDRSDSGPVAGAGGSGVVGDSSGGDEEAGAAGEGGARPASGGSGGRGGNGGGGGSGGKPLPPLDDGDSGCAMARPGHASTGFALTLLLGALGVALRRRRSER